MLVRTMGRLQFLWGRGRAASMFLLGSGLLSGCATLGFEEAKPPVMVSEVIRMTNEGVPAENIVAKMRDSKTVYRLDAAELAQLHDRGVADSIINYMQATYLDAVRREESVANWNSSRAVGGSFLVIAWTKHGHTALTL